MNDYLYRYQPFYRRLDENNTTAIVENTDLFSKKELYIPSPLTFNDPFDCKAFITHKGCAVEDLFYYCVDRVRYNGEPGKSEEEIQGEAFEMLCGTLHEELFTGTSELSRSLDVHKEQFLRDIKGDPQSDLHGIGVISLSEKNDDILMWGHYADCHKGYCLEFNRQALVEWLKSVPGKLSEVIYEKAYPTVGDYLKYKKENKLDELFLLIKSIHWSYEEELRILVGIDWKRDKPHMLSLPENILTGVIFGCEMLGDNIMIIQGYLDQWQDKPRSYRAFKSGSQYAVEIKQIS